MSLALLRAAGKGRKTAYGSRCREPQWSTIPGRLGFTDVVRVRHIESNIDHRSSPTLWSLPEEMPYGTNLWLATRTVWGFTMPYLTGRGQQGREP